MSLFGPAKTYNPLALEMAKGMWSQGMQMQPQTPLQLVMMMAQSLGGALGMRKQMGAYNNAKKQTMDELQSISERKPQTWEGNVPMVGPQGAGPQMTAPITPGPMQFGTNNGSPTVLPQNQPSPQASPIMPGPSQFGTARATMTENPTEFLKTKQFDQVKALMNSQIPEYQKLGSEMMIKNLTAMAPDFDFMTIGNGEVVVADKKTGQVKKAYQGSTPVDFKNIDPTQPIVAVSSDGSFEFIAGPSQVKDPGDRVGINPTTGKREYQNFNPSTGGWEWSGVEAPEPKGQTINVNTGEVPENTTGTNTAYQTKLGEANVQLQQLEDIIMNFEPEALTVGGRMKQGLLKLKSLAGFQLSDEELEQGLTRAEFYTRVADYANLRIKFITGAQMSQAEAQRLMEGIPNYKDDPLTFAGKLMYVYDATSAAANAYKTTLMQNQNLPGEKAHELAKAAADAIVKSRMDAYDKNEAADWQLYAQMLERRKEIYNNRGNGVTTPPGSPLPTPTPTPTPKYMAPAPGVKVSFGGQ